MLTRRSHCGAILIQHVQLRNEFHCLEGKITQAAANFVTFFYSFNCFAARTPYLADPSYETIEFCVCNYRRLNSLSIHLIQCRIIEFRFLFLRQFSSRFPGGRLRLLINPQSDWDLNLRRFFFVRWKSFETQCNYCIIVLSNYPPSSHSRETEKSLILNARHWEHREQLATNLFIPVLPGEVLRAKKTRFRFHCQLVYSKTNFPLDNYKKIAFYRLPLLSYLTCYVEYTKAIKIENSLMWSLFFRLQI